MELQHNSIIKFAKSSGVFFIGNVLAKAILFVLLPIYTKYIAPANYGYYDLSITYITIVTSMLFFDIWSSVMRFMYDSDDLTFKYKVILSGWSIFGVSVLGYSAVGILLVCFLDIHYVGFIFLYGLTLNFQQMYSFITRGFGKNTAFAISGILNTVVTVVGNVVLIVALRWDYSSLYIASILGNVIQIIYLESKVKLFSNMALKEYRFDLSKQILIYTLPLCINSVSYWLLTSFNRVVINCMMGDAANGIYAIGNKFGAMIALVTTCFTYAWQDMSFSQMGNTESAGNGAFFSKACRMYLLFLGAGTAVLMPSFYVLFPVLVHNSYQESKGIIPLFLLVSVIGAYSTFIGNIFYAIKNTKAIFVSMVVSCLLNLILCVPMIRLWGLNGANIAIFLGFAVNILIRAKILKNKLGFRFDLGAALIVSAWISASVFIYQYGNMLINSVWLCGCIGITTFLFRKTIKTILLGLRSTGVKHESV